MANKVHYRLKKAIEEAAIDAYEKEHGIGKYAPSDFQAIQQRVFPDEDEMKELIYQLKCKTNDGIAETYREEVRQDFEMTMFHLRAAERYLNQAFIH